MVLFRRFKMLLCRERIAGDGKMFCFGTCFGVREDALVKMGDVLVKMGGCFGEDGRMFR